MGWRSDLRLCLPVQAVHDQCAFLAAACRLSVFSAADPADTPQDAVASLYGAFPLEGFSHADVRQLGLDDGAFADDFLLASSQQQQQQQPALGLPSSAPSPADSPFVFGRNGAAPGAASAPQYQHQVRLKEPRLCSTLQVVAV